jgi:hypothetical protein
MLLFFDDLVPSYASDPIGEYYSHGFSRCNRVIKLPSSKYFEIDNGLILKNYLVTGNLIYSVSENVGKMT